MQASSGALSKDDKFSASDFSLKQSSATQDKNGKETDTNACYVNQDKAFDDSLFSLNATNTKRARLDQ
jgi:hypothetical protein